MMVQEERREYQVRRDKGWGVDVWGPCACPPWGSSRRAGTSTRPPHIHTAAHLVPTIFPTIFLGRTSTRPPHPHHITPCPYDIPRGPLGVGVGVNVNGRGATDERVSW